MFALFSHCYDPVVGYGALLYRIVPCGLWRRTGGSLGRSLSRRVSVVFGVGLWSGVDILYLLLWCALFRIRRT